MLITLKMAKDALAKYVGDGYCSDKSEVVDGINEAIELLIVEGHWKYTLSTMRLVVRNNCVVLPKEIETILKANSCTKPVNVWARAYEFMEGGPGTMDFGNNISRNDLQDLGEYPTFYPIAGLVGKLILVSDSYSDTDKTILVRGFDTSGKEVFDEDGIPGEQVPILSWVNGVEGSLSQEDIDRCKSITSFSTISSVEKPVTSGSITMALITDSFTDGGSLSSSDDTGGIAYLAKYHPDETTPSYRRFRLLGTSNAEASTITMLVKKRAYPLKHDSDILQIQSIPALRMMLKAIHEDNHGDVNLAEGYRAKALRILQKQLSNSLSFSSSLLDFRTEGFGFGDSINMD